MTTDGFGGVSSRSRAGLSLAPVSLDPLQFTWSMVMEFCIDWAVDDPGLESGVGIAKRYGGCHYSRVLGDKVLTAAECVDVVVVRNPQPQRLRLDLQLNCCISRCLRP